MNCIYIGTFIKQRRKELKLTQEQVCSGICDPVTLSRIENGKQTPSKSVISALLQRLGMPEARYYVLESKNELEIEALKKDIIACGVTRNVSLGFEKLSQLENLTVSDDHLTRQFILRSKALLPLRYELAPYLFLLVHMRSIRHSVRMGLRHVSLSKSLSLPYKFRFVKLSISYHQPKEHPYMPELSLFPAYVRTGHVRTYAAIAPQ